ncbi:MAG TPA: UvrD-helicase domain-containing protein, partial [Ktedonobacterales bacterium]|nr:UvrD-helicase domain-containing protein [Ktedonobacterales bacterium]
QPGLPPRLLAEHLGVSEDAVHQALAALLTPGAGISGDERAASAAPGGARLGGSSIRPALDPGQRTAAAAPAPALVVAGPGTGKTSTLAGRVAYLVFEQGVDPRQILALTFSNKAAQEMRERLNALLAEPGDAMRPAAGLPAFARPTVSTIHAFCGDLLRRHAPLVGLSPDFRLISEAEGYLLLREIVADLSLSYYQPLANPAFHFPALLAAISRAKDELADPGRYQALALEMHAAARTPEERTRASHMQEAARVYAAYQEVLTQRGDADFGDLIFLAVRLLREQPDVLAELRTRHTQLLVDEFQDINQAMGVLLHTLAGADGPIWAVGDADQAIYRFRGAAPANLARFTELYPRARVYPLGTNYRSGPPILRAAAAVAGALLGPRERRVLEAASQPSATSDATPDARATGPVITVATAPDDNAELDGLAGSIRANTARGYALADQAVLCRTRRQSQRVAAALAAAGVPARMVRPLLDQPEVKDILSIGVLLADASGAGLLRAGNILDHAFSREEAQAVIAAAQAQHTIPLVLLLDAGSPLAEVEGLSPAGLSGLARLGDVLNDLWTAPDVATGLARYVFALTGLARRALADESLAGRARAADLARLLALARAFEHQQPDARPSWTPRSRPQPGAARWAEFVDYLRVLTALGREPGGTTEDLVALESDGVRVLTVHGSKGLEFPIVYLPGLADGRFPTQRRGETAPPPAGLSQDDGEGGASSVHLVEEACLFYVAITRARDALVISHAERYGRRRYAPSPFLKPLLPLASDPAASLARVRWSGAPTADATASTEPHPANGAAAHATPVSGPTRAPTAADPVPAPEPGQGAEFVSSPPLRREASRGAAGRGEPLRPAAIETYQRCPRQYAYRYVYRLRPREVGLGTLRRGVHETLRELQARFAATGESGASHAPPPPALDEARTLFIWHWRAAVATEARATRAGGTDLAGEPAASAELEGPFGALYRRHGLRVVERAWLDLMRQHGLPVPPLADIVAPLDAPLDGGLVDLPAPGISGDSVPNLSTSGTGTAGTHPAPVPLGARLEQRVVLRVSGREIELTLDRVEGERIAESVGRKGRLPVAADAATSGPADALAPPTPEPQRFVRHRLGGSRPTPADLRSLLYAMAAEQERQPAAPELFQHNLTTGELERVRIDPRRRERLRDELTQVLAGMESGVYPAKPEPVMCAGCPFLLICPG